MSDKNKPTLEEVTKNNIDNFFNESESKPNTCIMTDIKQQIQDTTNIQENPQEINKTVENLDYIESVSKIYQDILKRQPDIGGLKHYANQLKFGLITEEQLKNILKESDEYKKKSKSTPIKMNDIPLKDFPLNDIPSKIKKEFFQQVSTKLTYCMMGTNRLDEFRDYIPTVLPYIDEFIFIDGSSNDGTLEYFKELSSKTSKIKYLICEWQDRFSEQRNKYLAQVKEGWILTSDTDEHFPEETLKQLRTLIEQSDNGNNYTGVKFQVEDITVDDNDRTKVLSKNVNEYWKALMFKYHLNIHYEGEPHETLTGYPIKWITSNLIYQHTRSKIHILTRATENFFISNSNRYSEKWAEFRFFCTTNNIMNFKEFWTLFEKHQLPKEIEEWISKHKDDNEDSGDSEVREMALLYNEVLPKKKSKEKNKIENTKNIPLSSHHGYLQGTATITIPNITYTKEFKYPESEKKEQKIEDVTELIASGLARKPEKKESKLKMKKELVEHIADALNEKLENFDSIVYVSLQLVKLTIQQKVDIKDVINYIELAYKLEGS